MYKLFHNLGIMLINKKISTLFFYNGSQWMSISFNGL